MLYLASPFVTLWSMRAALYAHDDRALRAGLDWERVRAGLKDSLGVDHPVQQISQHDELPGFGESFASGVASGMIDDDITPERLDAMLSGSALQDQRTQGMPHCSFNGPAQFEMKFRIGGAAPVGITMRIEKWRWKITRISLPQQMLAPPTAVITRVASTRS